MTIRVEIIGVNIPSFSGQLVDIFLDMVQSIQHSFIALK